MRVRRIRVLRGDDQVSRVADDNNNNNNNNNTIIYYIFLIHVCNSRTDYRPSSLSSDRPSAASISRVAFIGGTYKYYNMRRLVGKLSQIGVNSIQIKYNMLCVGDRPRLRERR